jgi:hypothetical protein
MGVISPVLYVLAPASYILYMRVVSPVLYFQAPASYSLYYESCLPCIELQVYRTDRYQLHHSITSIFTYTSVLIDFSHANNRSPAHARIPHCHMHASLTVTCTHPSLSHAVRAYMSLMHTLS